MQLSDNSLKKEEVLLQHVKGQDQNFKLHQLLAEKILLIQDKKQHHVNIVKMSMMSKLELEDR